MYAGGNVHATKLKYLYGSILCIHVFDYINMYVGLCIG